MVHGEVVYLDIIFFINLAMDYVILWTAGRFAQQKSSRRRLLLGAFSGAIFSLLLLYLMMTGPVPGGITLVLLKVLGSLLMVVLAFPSIDLRKFIRLVAYFYLVAFAMGGAMLGSIYLFQNDPAAYTTMNGLLMFLVNVRYPWLVAALAVALLVGKWGLAVFRRGVFRTMMRVPVVIKFNGRRVALNALVDTGNSLRDPLTRKPVVIVEYSAVKDLLPLQLQLAFEKGDSDLEAVVRGLEGDAGWNFRVRLIPFSSIGKHRGMLLGLRPDDLVVVTEEKTVKVKDVVVAIYHQKLSSKGEYRALLHPDLLETA